MPSCDLAQSHTDGFSYPVEDPLVKEESTWRDLCPWLLSCGYRLRPRYQSNWRESLERAEKLPKWPLISSKPEVLLAHPTSHPYGSLDATHVDSGTQVVLQRVGISEVEVARYLQRLNDSSTSSLPVLDILEHPTESSVRILVQPLYRPVLEPGFETIGEVLDFIYQAFKGLRHLHERNIFVGQLGMLNLDPIVMVPSPSMYPDSYHFMFPRYNPSYTQRVRPAGPRTIFQPKYYWRLSSISRRVDPQDRKTRNLFARDVEALGNLLRKELMNGILNFYPTSPKYMRHLVGTDIYPPHSLDWLSTYPDHSNPYPSPDPWDFDCIDLSFRFLHHPLGDPHVNPLTDVYPPTHPKYDRSPLSRLMRNMAEPQYVQKPTIFEATRALERILISMVPSSPSGSRQRSGDLPDEKTPMFMIFDREIDRIINSVNPFYLSYAPATIQRDGWITQHESFGPDVSLLRLRYRIAFVYPPHPPIEGMVFLNESFGEDSKRKNLLGDEKHTTVSDV